VGRGAAAEVRRAAGADVTAGPDSLLIAPARDQDDLQRVADTLVERIDATSRPLDADEDDGLTSSQRAETLHRLGVITIRRRRSR